MRFFSLLILCLALFSSDSLLGSDDTQLVESLIQTWTQRATSISSADFQWRSHRFMSATVFEILGNGPIKDLSFSEECALSVQGTSYHYSRDAMAWSAKQKEWIRSPYLSASDGRVA